MADLSIVAGSSSQSVNLFIQDSTVTTGAGKTALAYNSSGLTAYYTFSGANAASTAITLATLVAVNSAYSSGGFKEIDSANMPGWYRLDIPNAALAASKGRAVTIHLQGATGMAPKVYTIELTGWDNQDAVRGGLTSLPNVASGAAGAIPTTGTGSNQIALSAGNVTVGTVAAAASNIKKNASLSNYPFAMTDSATHLPKTALTVTATRSLDGGAFASCTNAPSELSNGVYLINLAATDLNANTVSLRFSATGADDRIITFITQP